MAKIARVAVKDRDLLKTLRGFFKTLLSKGKMDAVLVPCRLPMKPVLMPTLLSDPAGLDHADPLSPAFPLNAARIAARLTRRPGGGKIAAVMRPCEIRAFVELVKLKQGRPEDLVMIGIDCLGACRNRDYARWSARAGDNAAEAYARAVLAGETPPEDFEPADACRICEFPTAEAADLSVALYGVDVEKHVLIEAATEKGKAVLKQLGLPTAEMPPARAKTLQQLVEQRRAERDRVFEETRSAVDDLEKLSRYLADCVNCYNCRVACPVCYCRECVFTTDVFDHEPAQYLKWAEKKGALKLPTDTLFYHLTRLTHMSTACVGCGQCSNACPNDIPLTPLFRLVARDTQAAFNYQAGRDITEKPPLAEFRDVEFEEVVGLGADETAEMEK